MNRKSFIILGCSISFFILVSFVGQTWATDCLAIRKQIAKETDILQRKELAKQGINDCPNDPIINFEYAYAMERLRKYKPALKHYQIAAKLAPKNAKSYFGMADMYMNLDRPKDAVKAYKMGLSLHPDNKRAKNSLVEAKKQAKTQTGTDDGITSFVNPLEAKKAKKKQAPVVADPVPYQPNQALIMQEPEVMKPLIVNPIQDEALQGMQFDKAGHTDITGSFDDNQMNTN